MVTLQFAYLSTLNIAVVTPLLSIKEPDDKPVLSNRYTSINFIIFLTTLILVFLTSRVYPTAWFYCTAPPAVPLTNFMTGRA